MGYRKLEDVEGKILQAVIKVGARDGVSNVTARKVAEVCGISDFTVFNYYKNIKNLLLSAAIYYDTGMMQRIADCVFSGKNLRFTWDTMFDFLLANPDGALYYLGYVRQFGYDLTPNNPRSDEFLQIAKVLFEHEGRSFNDKQLLLMWDYVTTMALYYAEKTIQGYMDNTAEFKTYAKDIVFNGLDNFGHEPQ